MKSPLVRLAIAAVVVVVIFTGKWYSNLLGGVDRHIRLPDEKISTIPMEIGKWKGTSCEVEETLFGKIAAHEVISRSYVNSASDAELTLHGAVFNKFWRDVPHHPKICYRGSGWTTIKEEDFELDDPDGSPDGTPVTARLITFEKNNKTIFVLYWFQFGDYVVCDSRQLYKARRVYSNEETWPPAVKMMIQIPADRPERAKKLLQEFADELHKTTKKFK